MSPACSAKISLPRESTLILLLLDRSAAEYCSARRKKSNKFCRTGRSTKNMAIYFNFHSTRGLFLTAANINYNDYAFITRDRIANKLRQRTRRHAIDIYICVTTILLQILYGMEKTAQLSIWRKNSRRCPK